MNRLLAAILILLTLALYFHRLGDGSLAAWDESLTAERSREMAETGDWLTPQFGYKPDFQKPPLYYWITAALFRAVGPGEGPVRLPSILFALGAIVLVFSIGRGASGSVGCGLLCAALLALNPHWVNRTREGMLDSGVIFGVLGCTWALTRPGGGAWRAPVAAASLALAGLVKTPLALAGLAVPVLDAALRGERPWRTWVVVVACFVFLCGWWYVDAMLRWGPVFWDRFVVYSTWVRMTVQVEGHDGRPDYYLHQMWRHAPVVLVLYLGAMAAALVRPFRHARHATWLVASSAGLVLLILMASKRDTYLVLVYPFMALATGCVLWELGKNLPGRVAHVGWLAVVGLLAFGLVRGYVPVLDGMPELKRTGQRISEVAVGHDAVLTTEPEIGVLMFYSGRVAHFFALRPVAEVVSEIRAQGGRVLVVGRKKRVGPLRDTVSATLGGPLEPVFEEGPYVALVHMER